MTDTYRVLIAEDSGTVRDVLSFLLEGNGYETCQAEDGVAAVQEILRCPPDLVLLDVDMPKMNGYQVCRIIKSDKDLKNIPVVMLTSRDRKLDRMWGLSTGADAYLIKALDDDEEPFGELGDVLDRCLKDKQPRSRPATLPPPTPESEILDRLNALLDQMLFRMTLRRRVSDLAQALQDLDESVHSIISVLEQAIDCGGCILALGKHAAEGRIWLAGKPSTAKAAIDELQELVRTELASAKLVFDPTRVTVTTVGEALAGDKRFTATMVLPLTARQTTIGMVGIGVHSTEQIDPTVRETVELLLENAALVLDNAQLFAGLEQTNRELQQTLDELTSTQDRLAKSEKKVHQLEILIDQSKKEKKVAEIVDSEYFESLKDRVKKLRGA